MPYQEPKGLLTFISTFRTAKVLIHIGKLSYYLWDLKLTLINILMMWRLRSDT